MPAPTAGTDHTQARGYWQQALDRYLELGAPQADDLRQLLDR